MSRPVVSVGVTRVWVRYAPSPQVKNALVRAFPWQRRKEHGFQWDAQRFQYKLNREHLGELLRVMFRFFDAIEIRQRDGSIKVIDAGGREVKQESLAL